MLKLCYLPHEMGYVFLAGKAQITFYGAPRVFLHRKDAEDAARVRGLDVDDLGNVLEGAAL